MATNQPDQPKQGGITLNVEGWTLADVEQRLTAAYDNPVTSRLLEAARAKLLTRPEGPDPAAQGAGMIPVHIDQTEHVDIKVG